MKFDIRCTHLPMDRGALGHIRRRFEHCLDHFAHCVLQVHVLLSDVNGPKGGADKRCLVQLQLRGAPEIVIEEQGVELFGVIGRAADRLSATVGRAVALQKHQHQFRLA